jgi:hypothetical protein
MMGNPWRRSIKVQLPVIYISKNIQMITCPIEKIGLFVPHLDGLVKSEVVEVHHFLLLEGRMGLSEGPSPPPTKVLLSSTEPRP